MTTSSKQGYTGASASSYYPSAPGLLARVAPAAARLNAMRSAQLPIAWCVLQALSAEQRQQLIEEYCRAALRL